MVESLLRYAAYCHIKFMASVFRKNEKQNKDCSSNCIAHSCCSDSRHYDLFVSFEEEKFTKRAYELL
jgi:hypothetical protein